MFRLRSITRLTICALLIGVLGLGVSPVLAAEDVDPAIGSELPPVKGGSQSAEDDGDPDDYGITIPPDSLPELSPVETVSELPWSWAAWMAWMSHVVSFRD